MAMRLRGIFPNVGFIASRVVGPLPPKGQPGKTWRFKAKTGGVTLLALKSLGAAHPGKFRVTVHTKNWFSPALANKDATSTTFRVGIGTGCFSHSLTRKVD